jgi:hypothetical protein
MLWCARLSTKKLMQAVLDRLSMPENPIFGETKLW